MNLQEAIEHASSFSLGLFFDVDSLNRERARNEEAIALLSSAWMEAPEGKEPFSYELVRGLADRNRDLCDQIGEERLREEPSTTLARSLSDADLIRGVATLQGRSVEEVRKSAGPELKDLGITYTEAPVSGTVMGFDLETTSRDPARGYIINLGFAFMELSPKARIHDGHSAYFGIPSIYEQGVPLASIHQIEWKDLAGKPPFRHESNVANALIEAFSRAPLLAHNAAFEDSWLMLHLDGYAEARKAGKITLVDTRDICRRIDLDGRALPHDARPNALENWALRRGTLKAGESERHLGLDDVVLMLRTVQAEFVLRNMF